MICLLRTLIVIDVISVFALCSNAASHPHRIGPNLKVVSQLTPVVDTRSTALRSIARQTVGNEDPFGLTLDNCKTRKGCQGKRKCRKWKQVAEGDSCDTGWLCLCTPAQFTSCVSDEECEDGESCMVTMRTASPICVSDTAEAPRGVVPWGVEISKASTASPEEEESIEVSRGLSYDICRKSSDCKRDDLRCEYVGIFSKFDECGGRNPCRCGKSPDLYPCFGPQDCGPGEMCSETAITSFAVCVSETAPGVGIRRIPFSGVFKGLNLESCRFTDECRDDRICLQWIGTSTAPEPVECTDLRPCICIPIRNLDCRQSNECVDGEVCSRLGVFSVPICISEVMENAFLGIEEVPKQSGWDPYAPRETPEDSLLDVPPPSPDVFASPEAESDIQVSLPKPNPVEVVEEACIDVRALSHLASDELAFETDVISKVLCDGKNNCATGGHMIVVQGSPMMMRTYCEKVGCVERLMSVNNPRYKKGMRVESNSEDMQYTSFSARYGTRTEEGVLSIAIRVGL